MNNFYFRILSNFLGSLQEIGIEGFFSYKYLTISSECTASLLTKVSKEALVVRKLSTVTANSKE